MHLFKYTVVTVLLWSVLQVFAEECVTYDFEEDRDELFAEVRSCIDMPLWSVGFYNESDVTPPHPASKTFITPGSSRSCISSLPFMINSDGTLEVYVYMDSKSLSDEIQVLVNIVNPGGNDIAIGEGSLSSANGLVITDSLLKLNIGWFGLVGSWDGYLVFYGTAAEESKIFIDSYRYIPPDKADNVCILYEDVETTTQVTNETDENSDESTIKSTILGATDENSTESVLISTGLSVTDENSAESTIPSTISNATNENSAEENSTESTIQSTISNETDKNTVQSTIGSTITTTIEENSAESTIQLPISSETDENSIESIIKSSVSSASNENSGESRIKSTISVITDENSAESTIESTMSSETDDYATDNAIQSTISRITDENSAGSTIRSTIQSETDKNSNESTILSTISSANDENSSENTIRPTILDITDENSAESTIRSTIASATDEDSGESTIQSIISGITDENSAESTIRSTTSTKIDENTGSSYKIAGEMTTESIFFNTTDEYSEDDYEYYEMENSTFTTDSSYDSLLSNPTEVPVIVKPETTFWNTVSITALGLICLIVFSLISWCFYNCGRSKVKNVESAKIVDDYKDLQRPAMMHRVIRDGITYNRGNGTNYPFSV